MEYKTTIDDTHSKSITCIAYHPIRKEIFTGSEDSSIKVWDIDTGKHLATLSEHKGWITSLYYW
ncbi:hypothetical protein O9G_001873 [Rozella allomycis CSF55]|uniref:Uncharacterized protein n=1 Tax=Rozella allomycis (strain CSF55) TaxID=988480 RepID=A0A075AVT5_ROZAC|nr:hypothetical protein O9G_001873 [Rozella allomycis CSF55]|eukprot:EPZ34260.1 hypothetical protein O9G_001873 [Rozella allomycis CSF55]